MTKAAEVHVHTLRLDGVHEPVAVDDRTPRYSWVIGAAARGVAQTSVRVTVHDEDAVLIWDSGEVRSSQQFLDYGGARLRSATRYHWSAQVQTTAGAASASSHFETGLLDADEWQGSAWISGALADGATSAPAPLLRREFTLASAPARARLYLAAGGIAVARLNGQPIADEVLGPGLSDYDARVQYSVTDVTSLLNAGPNILGFELGRGFYGMTTDNAWGWEHAPWHAEPTVRALLRVEYAVGTSEVFGTDDSFRWTDGPTRFDSFYEGDHCDALSRRSGWDLPGFDDSMWDPVRLVDGPRGRLVARKQPPIRVVETLAPTSIRRSGDHYIVKFPRQIAGWVRIRVRGAAGETVRIRYGESLGDDGEVIVDPVVRLSGGDFQTDTYTLAGDEDGETWEPSFSYKGFQYVQVHGWPEPELAPTAIDARVLHADVKRHGRFSASDTLLTRIHEATIATVLNNLHHIPTDTPAYEKNGWIGDAQLASETMLRSLDVAPLLTKWMDDVSDSILPDGRPALIAPDPDWRWAGKMESPPWNAAIVLVPWDIYQHTGDERMLRKHYDEMLSYLRLEHAIAVGHISESGHGDFLAPDRAPENMALPGTAYVYHATRVLARIARLFGHSGDAVELQAEADAIAQAFNERWLTEAGYVDEVAGYRQGHNVLALAFGIVPADRVDDIVARLVANIRERDEHLWVGILGTKYLLPVLTAAGHGDLALRIATKTDFPSWGAWFEQGATTVWEQWTGKRSRNHYFFGTIDDWFFGDVAGLRQLEPGWRRLLVQPALLDGLDWVNAELATPHGRLAIEWERTGPEFIVQLAVPVGAEAVVRLPVAGAITEAGIPIRDAQGVSGVERDGGATRFLVGSGEYEFRAAR